MPSLRSHAARSLTARATRITSAFRVRLVVVGTTNGSGRYEVRGDADQRPALADEPPHLLDVHRLERPETAVQGLVVVKRGPAAEIAAVDQSDVEPALGRVPGRRGAVDAGANHQDVEASVRQPAEVAHHRSFIVRWWDCTGTLGWK